MTSPGPRFAHAWDALASVAAKMAEVRAAKPDAEIWRLIAADWHWVITHEGAPGFGHNSEARISAARAAAERAREPLAKHGIGDPAMLHYADRLMLTNEALSRLEKYELLAAIAWHEARIGPSGLPMIAVVTQINIEHGRKPRAVESEIAATDKRAAAAEPTPPPKSERAEKIPPPTHIAPARHPEPQQARLI